LAHQKAMIPEATQAANTAIALAPHDPTSWIAVGNVALGDGNLGEARRFYEHALALDPGSDVARLNLATVRENDGALGHAMDLLQSIIRLNPRDERARRRLDELAEQFVHEMLWLSLPVGFVLAIIVGLLSGAR
jgi:Flp pilus assembly protein TadD